MINKKIDEKYIKIGFVILAFLMYFIWSLNQPANTTPDEGMKFDIIKYIMKHGKLPHGGDAEIRNVVWGNSYGFTPILSYIIGALFVKIISLFTSDVFAWYVAARFVSVLCMTGTCIFTIKIADKLFKGKIKWVFISVVSLLPQVVFIGSYINNDSIALLSISIIIYAWLSGYSNKWKTSSCVMLGIGIGVCALSYYNAYGYILTSIFVFIVYFLIGNKISTEYKKMFRLGILVFMIAVIIAGWWFIRNAIIYDGDFLGLTTCNEYGEKYAIDICKPSLIKTPQREGISLFNMIIGKHWLKITFYSFVGTFSIMNFQMHKFFYYIYFIVFTVGFSGFILSYSNKKKLKELSADKKKIAIGVIFAINIIIPVVLSLYYSYYSDFQPQGRYIMPILIPFMYFVVSGLKYVIDKLFKNNRIISVVLSCMIFLNIVTPILCLRKVLMFYGNRVFDLLI